MTKIEQIMSMYPETGIINPYRNTKFYLTKEMQEFLNGYLLTYKDYPDAKIACEFAAEFEIDKSAAKVIEYDYVVVNRARIMKRIEKLYYSGEEKENIMRQIEIDFGLDKVNAEKYVSRVIADTIVG